MILILMLGFKGLNLELTISQSWMQNLELKKL